MRDFVSPPWSPPPLFPVDSIPPSFGARRVPHPCLSSTAPTHRSQHPVLAANILPPTTRPPELSPSPLATVLILAHVLQFLYLYATPEPEPRFCLEHLSRMLPHTHWLDWSWVVVSSSFWIARLLLLVRRSHPSMSVALYKVLYYPSPALNPHDARRCVVLRRVLLVSTPLVTRPIHLSGSSLGYVVSGLHIHIQIHSSRLSSHPILSSSLILLM